MSTTSIPSLVPPDPETYSSHLQNALTLINTVILTQAQSTFHLSHTYQRSQFARDQLRDSLRIMNDALLDNKKIIITGIGKSFKIASKIVATLNSLSLQSTILHPLDALHGDLGLIRDGDVMIMISASGSSSELINLLSHIDLSKIKILLLTCNLNSTLSHHDKVSSLLYLELPSRFKEENVYGLTAPTISTTLLQTLMDSVSILLSQLYISDLALRKTLFGERHPGGAIGQSYTRSFSSSSEETSLMEFDVEHIELDDSEKFKETIDLSMVNLMNDKTMKIKHLSEFPLDNSKLFEISILNDILVFNDTRLITTEAVIKTIRESQLQTIDELKWRVMANTKLIVNI